MTDTQSPEDPGAAMAAARRACRFCGAPLERTFVDLGMSPLCERILRADQLDEMEPFFPLHVRICDACRLVQLPAYVPPEEIFSEYAYFSSYSDSWVDHARRFAEAIIADRSLDADSQVIELASNDGYLLQHFASQGVPILGIEPAANVAAVAVERGIPTLVEFFGERLARQLVAEGRSADVLVANNVFAHVPDINDFSEGMRLLLAPDGVATIEVQHLARLIENNEFDTIYHEHFSYYSLLSAERVLAGHGLTVYDVEELPTHGGSLRLYVRHTAATAPAGTERLDRLRAWEISEGLDDPERYSGFAERVQATKRNLLGFLIDASARGCSVVGYGAPGKGNTLLNYCGIRSDLLAYTVDRNPYKHGRFLPGTHIPVHPPERIAETRPDYVLILPWNLRDEIIGQLAYVRDWGGRFVVPIPSLEVIE
jgi:SAM-dependent methyltransferase